MKKIDLSFLDSVTGNDFDSDEEIGVDLAERCRRAASLVESVHADCSAAENFADAHPENSRGSYLDDMVQLADELASVGIAVSWPMGVKPSYR